MAWIKQHTAWLLFAGLVALLVANAWLFLPRFVLQQQKLSAEDLQSQTKQLVIVAKDGADLTNKIANHTAGKEFADQLATIEQRADDAVITLQTAPYEVTLDDKVQERLKLAQIISFTLHDASFRLADSLQMSQTSQILSRASTSADTLVDQ